MGMIHSLLAALAETEIARQVAIAHDEARMSYPLSSNTVRDYQEFCDIASDYYNFHYTTCVTRGGNLSNTDAYATMKGILEQEYRRQGGDIVTAFNDAHHGTNGGMRRVLDIIADHLKMKSVEAYTTTVFDQCVAPNAWDDKVDIIRQFISC